MRQKWESERERGEWKRVRKKGESEREWEE